jgi:hypothetical protein
MRFLLTLGLSMSIALGGGYSIHGADETELSSLSFTAHFMKNGTWVDLEDATMKPLDQPLGLDFHNIKIHPEYTLNDILMQHLTQKLGIQNVQALQAYSISFLPSGIMITQIESIPNSAKVSPALTYIESSKSLRSISPLPFSSENTTSPLLEDITPPTLQKQNHEFTQWNALLTLKGDVLIQVINGKQLKVSFQSSD